MNREAPAPAEHRDVIVVGASAGGISALPRLLGQLPADLPAAVMIVQHLGATSYMHLAEILQRATPLKVQWAEHGDEIARGRVLVAPPGIHLLVGGTRVTLAGGPRENRARPSINRLFRSAARHYGGRVVAVLLTGMLDDGVAGLCAVKKSGGVTIVQDPRDAEYESMPRAALEADAADHVTVLAEMGALVTSLLAQPPPQQRVPDEVRLQVALDTEAIARPESFDGYEQQPLSCPECGGPMWEIGDGSGKTFRCYLGHADSAHNLLAGQSRELERSLWAAVRALQDRALTYEKLSRDAKRMGTPKAAAQYEARAAETRAQSEQARQFLVSLQRQLDPAAESS